MAGQSNMAGRGVVDGGGTQGTLEYVVDNGADRWSHLQDGQGNWVERDDVWIWCKRTNNSLSTSIASPLQGPLSARMGFRDQFIGPELGFGHVIGDYFEEQVLLIKHAWGGTAIGNEWLSPSQPGYTKPYQRQDPGFYYHLMLEEIDMVLSDIKAYFPDYDESEGHEIIGFVWHQGFNDQFNGLASSYEENLARFIGDVRNDLGMDSLPWVIGASEHSGGTMANVIRPAQLNIGDPAKHPEFEGNLVTTGGDLLQPSGKSPTTDGSHYYGNALTYLLIGEAMASGLIELLEAQEK